jgi:hypothetical protein
VRQELDLRGSRGRLYRTTHGREACFALRGSSFYSAKKEQGKGQHLKLGVNIVVRLSYCGPRSQRRAARREW